MRKLFLSILLFVVSATFAQSYEERFRTFQESAKENYTSFRDNANQQYADFMREAWEYYKSTPAIQTKRLTLMIKDNMEGLPIIY